MDIVFWIILLVVIAVVVWWLLNRNKSANAPGPGQSRADGALEGGSAAASAEAAGTSGLPSAAGFGKPAEPAAPVTADEPADAAGLSSPSARADVPRAAASGAGTGEARGTHEERRRQDEAEWETQWSEAASPAPRAGSSATGGAPLHPAAADTPEPAPATSEPAPTGEPASPAARPVHHDEFTGPHAPTLPGAETAAVEDADDAGTRQGAGQAPGMPAQPETAGPAAASHMPPAAPSASAPSSPAPLSPEPSSAAAPGPAGVSGDIAAAETMDRAQSSAVVENGADHLAGAPAHQGTPLAEPAGHLAADEPYGAGSAAPGPDGSGPSDYTVKGDATAMVYYEEGHPDYEQTRAEVWFESAAHAEAAGFRAPRRKRL